MHAARARDRSSRLYCRGSAPGRCPFTVRLSRTWDLNLYSLLPKQYLLTTATHISLRIRVHARTRTQARSRPLSLMICSPLIRSLCCSMFLSNSGCYHHHTVFVALHVAPTASVPTHVAPTPRCRALLADPIATHTILQKRADSIPRNHRIHRPSTMLASTVVWPISSACASAAAFDWATLSSIAFCLLRLLM